MSLWLASSKAFNFCLCVHVDTCAILEKMCTLLHVSVCSIGPISANGNNSASQSKQKEKEMHMMRIFHLSVKRTTSVISAAFKHLTIVTRLHLLTTRVCHAHSNARAQVLKLNVFCFSSINQHSCLTKTFG